MRKFSLDSSLWLPRPIDEVFAFFADAHNLEALTPPRLHFRTVTPDPIILALGTRFEHRLRVRGVPLRWESEITAWDPPRRFVDQQRRGPYRFWIHEHCFAPRDGGTETSDHVEYGVPGGALVNYLLVAPDLRKIFSYRRQVLLARFPQRKV
jgi:ligand-binding SRPBCC domain-containing protein